MEWRDVISEKYFIIEKSSFADYVDTYEGGPFIEKEKKINIFDVLHSHFFGNILETVIFS